MEGPVAPGAPSVQYQQWQSLNLDHFPALATADPDDTGLSVHVGRLQQLERSLDFMRNQQSEMLHALRSEIERLRAENNDLQYRLVMASRASLRRLSDEASTGESQHSEAKQPTVVAADPRRDEAAERGFALLSELAAMKQQLADETRLRAALQAKLVTVEGHRDIIGANSDKHPQLQPQHNLLPGVGHQAAAEAADAPSDPQVSIDGGRLRVLFDPLRLVAAAIGSEQRYQQPERPPTLSECQQIIRRLVTENARQSAEIDRLVRGSSGGQAGSTGLPTLELRPVSYRSNPQPKLPTNADNSLSRLPALTSAMGTRAADVRRRAQVLRSHQAYQQQAVQLQPLLPPQSQQVQLAQRRVHSRR